MKRWQTCLLWVDTSSSGWQKDVQKVLRNIHGVMTFRMHGLGMVEVSGTVNPQKVMKKLGEKMAIVWFQFGDCSANLFMPPAANPYESGWGYGGGAGGDRGRGGVGLGDGRFLHFDDVASSRMNNPFFSNNHLHRRTDHNGHCSAAGGNAKVTRCRVADGAEPAAYVPSAPPLPNHGGGCGGGINGCCLM